jgi:cytidine deaminase
MSPSDTLPEIDWQALIEVATAARKNAHAPYSDFAVGAAVLADNGLIYAGCNVENRSFGATICAERTAVSSAIAAGAKRLRAVAVITDTAPPSPPCGLCRETLAEFGDGELPILLVNPAGGERRFRLGELFPHPFVFPTSDG